MRKKSLFCEVCFTIFSLSLNTIFLLVLVYILAQLAIGAYVSRKVKNETDYILAGRSLGYGLGIFTIFATWFGSETCIGATSQVYENGLAGTGADPFGYGLCILLAAVLYAGVLWKKGLTTLADLFRTRYSVGTERVVALLLIPSSVLWAASQTRAFGQVLASSSGLDAFTMISIAAAIVIIYTTFGGMLADAWTDLIQGIVLILGLVALFVAIVMNPEGFKALQNIPADKLVFFPADVPWVEQLEFWSVAVIGSLVAAELVSRILATKNPNVARNASLSGGFLYLLIGVLPVVVGLAAITLLPDVSDSETVLETMAEQYLHPALYVLFIGALISAILSTVDSTLLVAGSLFSHNLVQPYFPDLSDKQRLLYSRLSVMFFGVVAYILAISSDSMFELAQTASAFGSGGVTVAFFFGLFTKFGGKWAAIACNLASVSVFMIGSIEINAETEATMLPYPFISSVIVALVVYVAVAFVEKAEPKLAPDLIG
jgi:Na+/proline symporter